MYQNVDNHMSLLNHLPPPPTSPATAENSIKPTVINVTPKINGANASGTRISKQF